MKKQNKIFFIETVGGGKKWSYYLIADDMKKVLDELYFDLEDEATEVKTILEIGDVFKTLP